MQVSPSSLANSEVMTVSFLSSIDGKNSWYKAVASQPSTVETKRDFSHLNYPIRKFPEWSFTSIQNSGTCFPHYQGRRKGTVNHR